jgi:hypothetical protein
MIDIAYFEEHADEARCILEAMGRLASERTGTKCKFSLAPTLDAAAKARVLELQAEAFGSPDTAFTAQDLDEVNNDPDALFIMLTVDGGIEGFCFGYWEWPNQITVPGTDFFLDSAMISDRFRNHGVADLAISGVLLLAKLLDCTRVGLVSWTGGARSSQLLRLYRRFGFVRVLNGSKIKMACALDDDKIARFLLELELTPADDRLPLPGNLWPRADERALIGSFYIALALSEIMYIVAPFEFAYLFLVMDRPQWAVGVTMAGIVASMIAAIPGGIIADRYSRKLTVLIGGFLAGFGLMALPIAVTSSGLTQFAAASGAFMMAGAGETLIASGAEAWIVDNLVAAGRPDLTQPFFARMKSVSALGAAIAGTGALLLLLHTVNRHVLDLLWYVGGLGFIASVIVVARIRERRPHSYSADDEPGTWKRMREALSALAGRRALLMISVAIVLGMASGMAAQEAFTVSLITKQFDARWFAPLGIVDSLDGVMAPVLGLFLAKRLGANRMLVFVLGLEVISLAILFVRADIATVVALYIILDLLDDAWDPVALARLQKLTPSRHRATIVATVYQFGSVAELLAVGAFGLMLGRNRAAIEQATPDLLEAFSGTATHAPKLPAIWMGLSVPDVAIVVFIALTALAIPMLLVHGKESEVSTPLPLRRLRLSKPRVTGPHVAD